MPFPEQPINDETQLDEQDSQGNAELLPAEAIVPLPMTSEEALASGRKYVAYTVKLPSEQLAALQTIWLELKRLYGANSPDKSGMIQQAIQEWLRTARSFCKNSSKSARIRAGGSTGSRRVRRQN
jgi:hypothetical protein